MIFFNEKNHPRIHLSKDKSSVQAHKMATTLRNFAILIKRSVTHIWMTRKKKTAISMQALHVKKVTKIFASHFCALLCSNQAKGDFYDHFISQSRWFHFLHLLTMKSQITYYCHTWTTTFKQELIPSSTWGLTIMWLLFSGSLCTAPQPLDQSYQTCTLIPGLRPVVCQALATSNLPGKDIRTNVLR